MSATTRGRRALKLLADPGRLLTSILLGNTFVNVAASSFAAGITADLIPGALGISVGVIVMTFLLLVLGEITPKTLARRKNREWIEASSGVVEFMVHLFSPLAKVLTGPASFADKFIPGGEEGDCYLPSELYTLMELARNEGILGGEADTAAAILELDERHCVSAMVPREKVLSCISDWSLDTVRVEVEKSFHTLYPCIDSATGLMTGVIDVKDVLGTGKLIIHKVPFFPESARLSRVLSELRGFSSGMGAVVDEYGDWTGIITVADILERAVFAGFTGAPLPEDVNRSGDGFLIPASLAVDVLASLFHTEALSSRYAESCGGLLQEVTGRLPGTNEIVEYSGFTFKVISSHGNSMDRLYVARVEES